MISSPSADRHNPLHARLAPIRRRQHARRMLRLGARGLFASALCGVGVGLWKWATGAPINPIVFAAVLIAGPVAGGLAGFFRRPNWLAAAETVDAHYRLKDRTATALVLSYASGAGDDGNQIPPSRRGGRQVLQTPQATSDRDRALLPQTDFGAWYALQLQDTLAHLQQVRPRDVVPLRIPAPLPYAAALLTLAGLLALPVGQPVAQAGPGDPLPAVLEAADVLDEMLARLEQFGEVQRSGSARTLAGKLRVTVDELKQPGVGLRDALARLSEMQAAIRAQQAHDQVDQVTAQLQALGAQMALASPLATAGKALEGGQFQKAAQELERLDASPLNPKQAAEAAAGMKAAAQEMQKQGHESLAKATAKLADGVAGDVRQQQAAAQALASQVREHAHRTQFDHQLKSSLSRLAESRAICQQNSLQQGRQQGKSATPSNRYGASSSGNPPGEKSELPAAAQREQLAGQAGDGPSEVETSRSAAGRQKAARSEQEVYQKYRRLSETVLDSEPLPLGHRQAIRRYFELIRPQSESDPTDAPAP